MQRLVAWFLRRFDLVRGEDHRLQIAALNSRVVAAEVGAAEAFKHRDQAINAREHARKQLRIMRDESGIRLEAGGTYDVDYDKLCKALGRVQCKELRQNIDDYMRGRNAPRTPAKKTKVSK